MMLNGDDSGLYGLQGDFGGKKTVDRIAQLLIKVLSFSFFRLRECFCCVCVFSFFIISVCFIIMECIFAVLAFVHHR